MSFGLGFLAGVGNAQRELSMREYDANLNAEKQKNEQHVNLLHDFMTREDTTPEVKQAAANALMQFSQTKGLPGAKHRQASLEPVLAAFASPRMYTSPDVAQERATGQRTAAMGSTMDSGIADEMVPGASALAEGAQSQGAQGMATPGEERHGFLRSDEIAQRTGTAAGIQTRSMYGAMGIPVPFGTPGSGGGSTPDYETVYLPNGKGGVQPHIIPKSTSQQQAKYLDSNGLEHIGYINIDRHSSVATDGNGNVVHPISLMTRDGYVTMTGTDGNNAPVKEVGTKSGFASGGVIPQYVPQRAVQGTDVTGHKFVTRFDPASGTLVGDRMDNGAVPNSDVSRERIVTNTDATRTRVAQSGERLQLQKDQYALNYDPSAYPGGVDNLPSGVPVVDGAPVGMRLYSGTREPGAILARGSAARSVVAQGRNVAAMVEDPQNAELMGKVAGRVSDLMTDGPEAFGLKWVGPLGTNNPNLSQLHAAVKSISDLLTTVHGRRAEEAAKNFAQSLKLVNSPQALAATIRQYAQIADEISAEAERPTIPTTRRKGSTPAATPTRKTATGGGTTAATGATKTVTRSALQALANAEKKTYADVKQEAIQNGYTVNE